MASSFFALVYSEKASSNFSSRPTMIKKLSFTKVYMYLVASIRINYLSKSENW